MSDFNVRSDSVNVEQIMDQIRARIREKRGVDYTEQQIRELAAVKLEKFIDPSGVRSDLLDQFRKARPAYEPPELPNFAFEDSTLFESHRGFIRFMRKLLNPILKLFFNPNPLIQALNIQSRLNRMNAEREARLQASRTATEQLLYEVIHNLVIELTRTGIEVKNMKMRVESLASRVEFNERRARALESVVVYRPAPETNDEPARQQQPQYQQRPQPQQPFQQRPQHQSAPQPASVPHTAAAQQAQQPGSPPSPAGPGIQTPGAPMVEGPGQRSRRRRRRRGRRGGAPAASIMGAPGGAPPQDQQQPGAAPANHDVPGREPADDHEGGGAHDDAAAAPPAHTDDESQ